MESGVKTGTSLQRWGGAGFEPHIPLMLGFTLLLEMAHFHCCSMEERTASSAKQELISQ